jgi:excisionase family DNA binding protein
MTDLLDTAAACDYLGGISRASLYREFARGKLKMTKVGASTRWRKTELDRYLRANERETIA